MSGLLLTVAVEGAAPGKAIGVKEAISMDLEKYGDVRVLRVEILEEEQMALGGVVPKPKAGPVTPPRRTVPVPSGGQAQAANTRPESRGPRRFVPGNMPCCLNCQSYQEESGMDESGKFRWGICGRTGLAVRELKDRCGAWAQEQTL